MIMQCCHHITLVNLGMRLKEVFLSKRSVTFHKDATVLGSLKVNFKHRNAFMSIAKGVRSPEKNVIDRGICSYIYYL